MPLAFQYKGSALKCLLALSLVLATIFFSNIVWASTLTSNSLAYIFGRYGRDGYSGSSGYGGRSGADITVFAKGQYEYFDLRGTDGENGTRGTDGEDATDCYQSFGPYDLEGASGGNGGYGGSGGSGGNGGSIRVHYLDVLSLKNIVVDSTPGRSGYPGEGGRGGLACRCSTYSWRDRVCRQHERYVTVCKPSGCDPKSEGCSCKQVRETYETCDWENFSCRDGREGRDGISGSYGNSGSFGEIEIVNRLEALEPTQEEIKIPIENLLDRKFALSRHEWTSKSGAVTLFGPGSRIQNLYKQYLGQTQRRIEFVWQDNTRDTDYYRGYDIEISLAGNPAHADLRFPYEVLANYKTQTVGDHTQVFVQKTMKRSELTNIRIEELYGTGQDLTLVLADNSNVSDVSKTKLHIKSGWDLEGGGEWNDWVPDHLIRSEIGKIMINLGRLPSIKASKLKKYFSETCEFELQVIREFAGNSAQFTNGQYSKIYVKKEIKNGKPIEVKWRD